MVSPPPPLRPILGVLILSGVLLTGTSMAAAAADLVDFNRDVRPIISDKCFHCHGPDADNQKSDFRLNTRENAIADLGDFFGIVPGNLEASELHWRIREEWEEELMPPVSSKLSLTEEEKNTLDRWIEQGAPYDQHWSFKPITHPVHPEISADHRSWTRNAVDTFVVAKLVEAGLSPSPAANRETLLRRVTLDLTGLPPTLVEMDAFLTDDQPGAWERVIDRLLDSPRYGERMALVWLDAARYADSGGYQNDIRRTQWPWRDWVIEAYNANMPFDQFTLEQLAGDLLENPSSDQLLATAFNRNHRINNEGGIIPEEYLVEYVADRVETTSTVWLGLTMGCARCHDHKYDPLSQRNFYEMFAFFNNVPEKGRDGDIAPQPNMAVYHGATETEHEALQEPVEQAARELESLLSGDAGPFTVWLESEQDEWRDLLGFLRQMSAPALHVPFDSITNRTTPDFGSHRRKAMINNPGKEYGSFSDTEFGKALEIGPGTYARVAEPHVGKFDSHRPLSWLVQLRSPAKFAGSEGPVLACAEANSLRGYRLMLEETDDPDFYRASFQMAYDVRQQNGLEVVTLPVIPKNDWSRIGVTWDGSNRANGVRFYFDGQPLETETLLDNLHTKVQTAQELLIGARDESDAQERMRDSTFLHGAIGDLQIYDEVLSAEEIQMLSSAHPRHSMMARLDEQSTTALKTLWVRSTPEAQQLSARQEEHQQALTAFENQHVVQVSIMKEMATPRETYLLDRGAYDRPDTRERLEPAVPAALPPMDDALPRNRLGFARWLLDPAHPLTARVAVNRYWQMYFGNGLVKTPEDFGSQGANPSHPALLDWLASEFIASDWDIKAMQKLIVMSATYRQSSRVSPELLERDPANELLTRGPRFRLNGQALRDQALAVSGLLTSTQGGPPVMPYQPEGLWDELSAKGYKYIEGDGADLYRRSLYTFWRRTIPPPSMMNFDNSSREICSVRLNSTNTPLQALNLMNDPQFVEAARQLAQRMILEGGNSPAHQITYGHRTVLARHPPRETHTILSTSYTDYWNYYSNQPDQAQALINTGASDPAADIEPANLAAMTMIASVLLNLDETLTKQ